MNLVHIETSKLEAGFSNFAAKIDAKKQQVLIYHHLQKVHLTSLKRETTNCFSLFASTIASNLKSKLDQRNVKKVEVNLKKLI